MIEIDIIILSVLAWLCLQTFKNHGCLKRLEGMIKAFHP
jgi:hypothetical protein